MNQNKQLQSSIFIITILLLLGIWGRVRNCPFRRHSSWLRLIVHSHYVLEMLYSGNVIFLMIWKTRETKDHFWSYLSYSTVSKSHFLYQFFIECFLCLANLHYVWVRAAPRLMLGITKQISNPYSSMRPPEFIRIHSKRCYRDSEMRADKISQESDFLSCSFLLEIPKVVNVF